MVFSFNNQYNKIYQILEKNLYYKMPCIQCHREQHLITLIQLIQGNT